MHWYNTKAKIQLHNEQAHEEQRTRMKNRLWYNEVTNGRGRVKEGIKEGEYGWFTLYTRMHLEF
jgi:hypothetical protein